MHLFHYADLWADLGSEMALVADALGATPSEHRLAELTDGATLAAMRARADQTVPDVEDGIWSDPAGFFRSGGDRGWESLLDAADLAHFDDRLDRLAGDAADWVRRGRAALI